ncbi:hypothetical protein AB0A63_35535 [Lentzea sp. NPDC042327]|uniref:hypothetical protein n=1 Tax=Lentzea sp. NPDC042327 TaxID=3154801 RepID=UPI0034004D96
MLTGRLFAAHLGVSFPHALWDSMNSIAVVFTLVLTDQPWRVDRRGRPPAEGSSVAVSSA